MAEKNEEAVAPPADEPYKLGMWMGVFVPTFQNILGIILFLRLPKIAGHAGISGALGIVLLSCFASFLTVLSMSAVATNVIPKKKAGPWSYSVPCWSWLHAGPGCSYSVPACW